MIAKYAGVACLMRPKLAHKCACRILRPRHDETFGDCGLNDVSNDFSFADSEPQAADKSSVALKRFRRSVSRKLPVVSGET